MVYDIFLNFQSNEKPWMQSVMSKIQVIKYRKIGRVQDDNGDYQWEETRITWEVEDISGNKAECAFSPQ